MESVEWIRSGDQTIAIIVRHDFPPNENDLIIIEDTAEAHGAE